MEAESKLESKSAIAENSSPEHFQGEVLELLKVHRPSGAGTEEDNHSTDKLVNFGFPSADHLLSGLAFEQGAEDKRGQLETDERPKEKPFTNDKVTDAEKELLKEVAKPEQIEKVKAEINRLAREPRDVILNAAEDKKNRVVGLGEWHVTPNGLRTLAQTMMGDFKKQGITHLAVEIHEADQKILDRFAKGSKEAGEELKKLYGGIHDDSLSMMAEAAKKGIKLVAVDGDFDHNKRAEFDKPSIEKDETQSRDNRMAKNIETILKSDSKARVLFVVGAGHLEAGDKKGKSAGAQLRENGFPITTFGSHMEGESTHFTTPELTKSLSRAVAVETNKTEALKQFPATTDKDGATVGRHDFAVFFPKDSSLKILEQVHGKDSPKLLPDLEAVTKVALAQGNSERTEALVKRTVDIAKKEFGAESKQVADIYERLARASKDDATVKLHLQSMLIREKLDGGKPSPDYARSAGYVVQLYLEGGNVKDATRHFNKAAENLLATKGNSTGIKEFLDATSDLSKRLQKAGDKDGMTTVLEKRVELKAKNDFPPGAAFTERMTLAEIYDRQRKPAVAEKTFRAALAEAGSDPDNLFAVRRNFAKFLDANGKPEEAEKLQRKNYEQAVKEPGKYFEAITDLAKHLESQKKDTEAAQVYRVAMENWEKGVTIRPMARGEKDREFLTSYAAFLKRTGKEDEASKVEDKVKFSKLAQDAVYGYSQRKNTDETLKTFQQAMTLWEKGASNKEQGGNFLENYASFLERNDKSEDAKKIRGKMKQRQ